MSLICERNEANGLVYCRFVFGPYFRDFGAKLDRDWLQICHSFSQSHFLEHTLSKFAPDWAALDYTFLDFTPDWTALVHTLPDFAPDWTTLVHTLPDFAPD